MSIDRNREGIIQFQRALMVEKDSEKPTQDEIDEYLHKPFQPSEKDDRVHNNRYREYIISVFDVDNCNGKLFSSTRADLDE